MLGFGPEIFGHTLLTVILIGLGFVAILVFFTILIFAPGFQYSWTPLLIGILSLIFGFGRGSLENSGDNPEVDTETFF